MTERYRQFEDLTVGMEIRSAEGEWNTIIHLEPDGDGSDMNIADLSNGTFTLVRDWQEVMTREAMP